VEFNLDQVLFVPAHTPPHKEESDILDQAERYRMVEMAVLSNPAFRVSDLELKRAGVSYTVDTLEYFCRHYPSSEIFFIMGLDSLFILDTWKDVERLIQLCRFIIVTRPGYNIKEEVGIRKRLPAEFWSQANFLAIPGLDISSSDIRMRVAQGKPIRYMLPETVENYIRQNNIYREG
jgi:nicotinate-nucleotide adenylyltransferase